MKKDMVKGFTMVMLVVVLALVSAVASVSGQSASKVVADIPFEFNVGYKTMPAGEYQLQILTSSGDALMIQCVERGSSAVRLTEATAPAKIKLRARLVFHRYGQEYFLAEVWNGMDKIGRQLVKSQEERTLQLELASIPTRDTGEKNTYETIEVLASLR